MDIPLIPGVEYKIFCSFGCTNSAIGEVSVEAEDGETIDLPICQECLDKISYSGPVSLDE